MVFPDKFIETSKKFADCVDLRMKYVQNLKEKGIVTPDDYGYFNEIFFAMDRFYNQMTSFIEDTLPFPEVI